MDEAIEPVVERQAMVQGAVVQRAVEVDAPPDAVWEALTDDDALSAWFGGSVTLDPVSGGEGRFEDEDGTVRRAHVDQVVAGRRLAFRWWPEDDDDGPLTSVTFELIPVDGATRLVVTEHPLLLGTGGWARDWAPFCARAGAWATVVRV